jgi:mannose-6-phosphate isomerase class I
MAPAFNKFPRIKLNGKHKCTQGWDAICKRLLGDIEKIDQEVKIITVETYHGVNDRQIIHELKNGLSPDLFIDVKQGMYLSGKIKKLVYPDVTDDRIFGYMTRLKLTQFFDPEKTGRLKREVHQCQKGLIVIYGCGASLLLEKTDILVYADMARWEIQQRFRRLEISNLGVENSQEDFARQYKQAYFVDWRVCDKLKKSLFEKIDFVLDTNQKDTPKMISGKTHLAGLREAVSRPFNVVPFFDPGPWGGQWMKEVCGLNKDEENFAWCFNCVPEENSLLLDVDGVTLEIPSINVVFYQPERLLGPKVHARFGDEFPIRFDFLDTMDGGNLSLQVHPLTEYIQENFGLQYTQDESYYLMDAKPGAEVYLGLKDGIDPQAMITELKNAQKGGRPFEARKYVQTWPAKKHDHFLIPAGTIHCSGKDSMVLEISATPYIFTFKLWDWGRFGMDSLPRPINIEHGENVIQWERTTFWTEKELVNQIKEMARGDGWREERTGLHEREFIETRRHWFLKKVLHNTENNVQVLNLVEGDEIIVESPEESFEPFVVHYAETFIVPAAVGEYTIRPYGKSAGKECATMKAYVRG